MTASIKDIASVMSDVLAALDADTFNAVLQGKADVEAPASIKSDVDAWISECLAAEGKISDADAPAAFGPTYDAILSLCAEAGRTSEEMGDLLRCSAVFDSLMRLHFGFRPDWMKVRA